MSFSRRLYDYYEMLDDNEVIYINYNNSKEGITDTIEKEDYVEIVDDNTLFIYKNDTDVRLFINLLAVRRVSIRKRKDCANIFKSGERYDTDCTKS